MESVHSASRHYILFDQVYLSFYERHAKLFKSQPIIYIINNIIKKKMEPVFRMSLHRDDVQKYSGIS